MPRNIKVKLEDKVVWITGASSGIGEALAFAMNREGAKLILSGRHADTLERVAANCSAKQGAIVVLPLDLAQLGTLADKAQQALNAFGRVDILVNNGGIGQFSPALETSLAVDEAIIRVNYLAQVALTKAILPSMIERKSGHIVVVSSLGGKIATPGRASYSASKHALHGYFDSLRGEIWRDGIKVTLVCPGYVKTNFRANALSGDGVPYGEQAHSYRFAITASECAEAILKAIVRGKEEVYMGRLALAIYAYRFFPGIVSQIVRRISTR